VRINVGELVDVVVLLKGEQATQTLYVDISGEASIPVDLEIRPVFLEDKILVNDNTSYRAIIAPNTTLNLLLSYDTSKVGVYPGYFKILFNNTEVNNIPLILVILPSEADPNKTIWNYGYGEIAIGPDPSKDIEAQLKLRCSGVTAGIIAIPLIPRSGLDYLVYAYCSEQGVMGILTIFIPDMYRNQGYYLVVEKEGVVIRNIDLSSLNSNVIQVEIEPEYTHRLTVTYSAPSPTPSQEQPVETAPGIYGPFVIMIIITILAYGLILIYISHRKKMEKTF